MTADAQALRRQLQQSGATQQDLQAVDEVLRALRGMSDVRGDGGLTGIQQLSASALERMRKLEFDLRQRTDTTSNQLFLSGTEDVPSRYRDQVQQYYRELSRQK